MFLFVNDAYLFIKNKTVLDNGIYLNKINILFFSHNYYSLVNNFKLMTGSVFPCLSRILVLEFYLTFQKNYSEIISEKLSLLGFIAVSRLKQDTDCQYINNAF